ncbi:MAG: hypothetical protein ACO1TE_05920 [Prosthecobacter sp.]
MKDTSRAVSSPPSLASMFTCFLPSLFFVLMAAWLMTGGYAGPVLDAQGSPVLDEFGRPIHVIHKWKSWLVNWRSLICIGISGVLFLIPIVGWVRHGWHVWSARHRRQLVA